MGGSFSNNDDNDLSLTTRMGPTTEETQSLAEAEKQGKKISKSYPTTGKVTKHDGPKEKQEGGSKKRKSKKRKSKKKKSKKKKSKKHKSYKKKK